MLNKINANISAAVTHLDRGDTASASTCINHAWSDITDERPTDGIHWQTLHAAEARLEEMENALARCVAAFHAMGV